MLPSPHFSKVYGHGHIKKFWLMQNQKESESKALLASSSASPTRHVSSSGGLGHESKQGPQFCLGNVTSRSLSSPSGVFVRSSVSGPACSNMSRARHAGLATCAESLSPSLHTDQLRNVLRPSSPSFSANSLEEGKSLADDDDALDLVNPSSRGSAFTSQCDSPFVLGNYIAGGALRNHEPTSKDVFDSSIHDQFSSRQDSMHLQERSDNAESCNSTARRSLSQEPGRCSLKIVSSVDNGTPFTVPFQLSEKYCLSERSYQGKSGCLPASLLLDCEPVKSEPIESTCFSTYEARKEVHAEGVSGLRTCSVCRTSKTPLWRSGPQGPKSLCNACGIRYKKAKRSSGEGSAASLPSPQNMKNLLKPAKRKQDTVPGFSEVHVVKPLVIGSPTLGFASQVAKKRRWSRLLKKGDYAAQKCEVTGSSGESSLTWSLNSPRAISSPSVTQFERLSIVENAETLDMVAGKDEEEAALLLMYMSCGRVFS